MKLVIEEKKFKVNKKNGVVICELSGYVKFPEIEKLKGARFFGNFKISDNRGKKFCPEYLVARGVTKCHPEDKFDETVGKRIAANKARLEMYGMVKQIINKLKSSVDVLNNTLEISDERLEKFKNREKSRLNELSHSKNV